MTEDDLELVAEFKTESLEHFEHIEPMFLEIEDSDAERRNEVVNAIFRAVHSVKGAAGFFGLTLIQDLSHAAESLLMKVRDGELDYRPEMTDVLLAALDKLQRLVDALPEELEFSIQEDLDALRAMAAGEVVAAPPTADAPAAETPTAEAAAAEATAEEAPAAEAPAAEAAAEAGDSPTSADASQPCALLAMASAEALAAARRFGRGVFVVTLPPDEASDPATVDRVRVVGQSVGNILSEQIEGSAAAFLVDSVLDPKLLAGELGLPEESVGAVDGAALERRAAEEPSPSEPEPEPEPEPKPKAAEPASSAPKGEAAAGSRSASSANDAAETIRVSVRLLDQLMNLAGELVLARNQLVSQLRDTDDPNLRAVLQNIDLVTSEL